MKNGVFWVVTPCGSCKNPEDTILQYLVFLRSVLRLLIEALDSYETSVLTKATWRNTQNGGFLQERAMLPNKSMIYNISG
jgi:hypothetical protein